MSPWHSVLLILLICLHSYGAPTSLGPTSNEEANFLWNESKKAIQNSQYLDASHQLQRYVDRYPGKPHYIEAHLLLGKALFELGKFQEAIVPLKYYVSAVRNKNDLAEGKIILGRTYLSLRRFHEANLVSLELDQISSKTKLSPNTLLESNLLKSESLLEMKRFKEASEVIDLTKQFISEKTNKSLKGRTALLSLKIKIKLCEEFPTPGPLDEREVHHQLSQRGACLLESLLQYQKILNLGESAFAQTSTAEVSRSFDRYTDACLHPPRPPENAPKKRTEQEIRRYQSELADFLLQECKKKSAEALDLLSSWKTKVPASMSEHIKTASQSIEKNASRNP